jgi:hypothetical protein
LVGNLQISTPVPSGATIGTITATDPAGPVSGSFLGNFNVAPTGGIVPSTGTFTQVGTTGVAATNGTQTFTVGEVAASDPVTVLIHQSQP